MKHIVTCLGVSADKSSAKKKRTLSLHPYHSTCGFFRGFMYYSGYPLYVRKRDQSLFIIRNGRRVSVALVNTHGTVVLLAPDAVERAKTVLL